LSLSLILEHLKAHLVSKVNTTDFSEQDKLQLRSIIMFHQRMNLYKALLQITDEDEIPSLQDCQQMMIHHDFVGLTMDIFFDNNLDDDQLHLFDQILFLIMEHCYCEIALHYEAFLSSLPLEKISIKALLDILPPNPQDTNQSGFWKNVRGIMQTSSKDLIDNNQT
jgi:hypothetical protein